MNVRQILFHRVPKHAPGVTLVELLVVMGIIAVMFSITIISIAPLRDRTLMSTVITSLLSDIKQQQIRAMIGDTDGNVSRSPYGVYLDTSQYTVYPGSTYSPVNEKNFSVSLNPSLSITTTFPNDTLVFASGSGELAGYTPGQDTIIVAIPETNEQKTITFNKYGVVISVE